MVSIKRKFTPSGFELRPWGSFEVIHQGGGYKIKRLYILPHEETSLQTHQHRSEHWIVESGSAKVTIEDKVIYLLAGASITVPKNAAHRISNEGAELLTVFEVQLGDILDESDITRIEDKYGRV